MYTYRNLQHAVHLGECSQRTHTATNASGSCRIAQPAEMYKECEIEHMS